MVKTANSVTLKDKVFQAILDDITNGKYTNGRIITEKYLISKYKVSRSPIREALTQLTADGILLSIPRHGYKMAPIDDAKLLEIVKLRAILECGFFETYYKLINSADMIKIKKLCDDYEAIPQINAIERWHMNAEFHLALFSFYKNQHAYEILNRALVLQSIYYLMRAKSMTYSASLHVAVLDYLEKKDIKMASQLLRADIESILSHT